MTAGILQVDNETFAQATRETKEGKKYSYRMRVLQQPSRARACGAGAKSSADRRPVDPPPIVELTILDENNRDVTFSMNANYFLFITLEQARNIAPARSATHDAKSVAVLTGTPVAGMVCLDRPHPAGYFIFPDLSVRHEGSYRLSFSLFEDLKDAKDEDRSEDISTMNGACDGHVTHRLEVKSEPFTVYSAKKFPGLKESTALSRQVAEQGCRVRIRRDVRMRKRDGKGGKEWDNYEEQTADARSRMSSTPEASAYPSMAAPQGYGDNIPRPRSSSNASHHSLAPSLPLSRRPSLQEMNQAYAAPAPAYGTAPHTPHSTYQSSPYGPSPQQQSFPQSTFPPQQPTMQAPPLQFPCQNYQPPPPVPHQRSYYGVSTNGPPPAPPSQNSYGAQYSNVTQHSGYEQQEHLHRPSMDYAQHMPPDYARSSSQYSQQSPASAGGYARHESVQMPPTHTGYPPSQHPHQHTAHMSQPMQHPYSASVDQSVHRPMPAEPVQPPMRTASSSSFRSDLPRLPALPPLQTSAIMNRPLEPSPISSTAPTSRFSLAQPSQPEPQKRGYSEVFNDRHINVPLRQGARPSTPGNGYYQNLEVDDSEPEPTRVDGHDIVSFRKSNGQWGHRVLEKQT